VAGFYAAVVLYSDAWRLIVQAAGEQPPWPGAPIEWTADQQRLWALTRDYRSMVSAIVTADDELPGAEILASPAAFREWFDDWIEERKLRSKNGGDGREEHGWVLR
jgi:hypothetical protein